MKKYFLIIPAILILVSCASVVSPSGGAIDKQAPVAKEINPENGATNFDSKRITFQFDEYIQLRENGNQIIISPPVSNREFKLKKKSLELHFDEDLQPNTTYSVQFGNSVSDITEGNVLDTFSYVFSTGSFLDSLSISGQILDAITGKPSEGVLVNLYKSQADSIPFKVKPSYFTKTNSLGNFSLKNLSPGKYLLFSMKDENSNFLFDAPKEAIAFNPEMIEAEKDTSYQLRMFKELPQRLLVEKTIAQKPASITMVFNKPVDSLKILSLQSGKELENIAYSEWSLSRDTFYFWLKDTLRDSLSFVINSHNNFSDTLRLKVEKQDKINIGRESGLKSTGSKLNVGTGVEAISGKPLILRLDNPIRVIDTTQIVLYKDSIQVTSWTLGDSKSREINISYEAEESAMYKLCFLPGAWENIYETKNDSLCFDFRVKSSRENGNLQINFTKPANTFSYILQLLDAKEKIAYSALVDRSSSIVFNYIQPGEYVIRVIEDANANQRFDSGDWLRRLQAEKVSYYKEKINVRANWDMEISWILQEGE